MPMFETNILCPICQFPLTDVDGMLECQNWGKTDEEYEKSEWHFYWIPDTIPSCGFNFESWAKSCQTKQHIIKRAEESPEVIEG